MEVPWITGSLIIGLASFIFGLTGFGIGLVALGLLPFVMPPAVAVPLVTIYGAVCGLVMTVQLRRDIVLTSMRELLLGTIVGIPLGVWGLATLPASLLKRCIGAILLGVVGIEWCGYYPARMASKRWGIGAGFVSGVLGAAVATPGPPVILYAVAQGWSPRAVKATLQAFFLVNYAVTGLGHWSAGVLTTEVLWLALGFSLPAAFGVTLGMQLFGRIEQRRFRHLVFALLLLLGVVLLVRG